MQCELIYYIAHKSSYNESVIYKKLSRQNITVNKAISSINPEELSVGLSNAVKRSNLVFLIGGLYREDSANVAFILSHMLSNSSGEEPKCQKITNTAGEGSGYILQSGRQMIILLPDSPEELEVIFGNVLLKYICDFYNLPFTPAKETSFNKIQEAKILSHTIREKPEETENSDLKESVPPETKIKDTSKENEKEEYSKPQIDVVEEKNDEPKPEKTPYLENDDENYIPSFVMNDDYRPLKRNRFIRLIFAVVGTAAGAVIIMFILIKAGFIR